MKRLLPLLFLFALLLTIPAHAQEERTDIAHIQVSLWPDFDDASLLVLVTAALPDDAALPVTITFPLPEGYDRIVVARITGDDMIDDLKPITTADSVTFTTPEQVFRIEYYIPYTADGDQRQIDFSWLATTLNVDSFQVTVQQPAAAATMTTEPAALDSGAGMYQLTEHLLPAVSLPAGTAYEMTADYTVNSRLLSIDLLNDNTQSTADDSAPAPAPAPEPAAENNDTLIIIFGTIGVLLIATAVGWYIYSSRQNNKPPQRPKPTHSKKKRVKATGFCHECGSPLTSGAKFCASCGTAVKKK